MRRTFGLPLLALAVAFGITVLANEKPTAEHQDIMKATLERKADRAVKLVKAGTI